MTNTVNKRKVKMPAGIQQKMMAAVSMLVVSSIMVVSSTYAWFTLSTAPEVTGITTNVGANGNLEMALLNYASYISTEDDLGIESNVGDSMANQAVTDANETWGNLVDLSSDEYHLSDVVLTPARLNITRPTGMDQDIVGTTILKAPSYGNDGRVIDIDKDTYTGSYTGGWVYNDAKAGVRAIGTSTGVTKRVSAYRNALTAKASATSGAKNAALNSLSTNGQELANILVGHVQDPNAKYARSNVTTLQNVVNELKTANDYAGTAIKNAVLAYTLSASNTNDLTDDQVTALVTAVGNATAANVSSVENIQVPDNANAVITQWSSNDTAVSNAKTSVDTLLADADKTEFTYDEIATVMDGLINKTNTKVAGVQNPSKENLQTIVDYLLANGKVDIEMLDGSGIYADIAKLAGNYTLSGMKVSIHYSNVYNGDVNATMATKVTSDNMIGTITVGDAPAASVGGAGTTTTLSDTYGYALDFGFRTNASVSDLQLQTEGVQRVYAGNDTEPGAAKTQGSGSSMTFTSANTRVFSVDEVRALMSAVRVAFVSPATNGYDILGIAAPDITATTDNSTGITSYTGGTLVGADGADTADTALASGIKAELYLYNFTKADDGVVTLGDKADSSKLASLTQNVAKKVTAIVYLDGDLVDNTMVANAQTSMSGKLNLQFSSSATLVPMENSAMRQGGIESTAEVTYTQLATAGASFSQDDMTGTVRTGYTIYKGSNGKYYFSADNGATKTQMTKGNFTTAIEVTSVGP